MAKKLADLIRPGVLVRIILCLAIVGAGVSAMGVFTKLKKKPKKGTPKEMVLQVTVAEAVPETVMTRLKGFGVARPVTEVRLYAEVAGKLVYVHPDFRTGKTLSKGEVIFKIDSSDYEAALAGLRSLLAQKRAVLDQTGAQYDADKTRLPVIARTMELARAEYRRVKTLLEENSIGNRSAVDQAEQAMNGAIDSHAQMKRALSLYPAILREQAAAVASVKADLKKAEINVSRCTVAAPFTGRVKSRSMELGEFAAAGKEVLTLADDSLLEILVSLDAREVSSWLQFGTDRRGTGWFGKPLPVGCTIQWTEARDHSWTGTLARVVNFDQASRTVTLAVRFDPSRNSCAGCPVLVEGMFCAVAIPGKPVDNLFRVKRWLVTTDNTLYVAKDNRLETRQVERIYAEGDWLFVRGQIAQGERIITTRLVDPLEHAALDITGTSEG